MKLFSLQSLLWSSLLVLCASQSEDDDLDVCWDEDVSFFSVSSLEGGSVEEEVVSENFLCLVRPTQLLNCSWWFPVLHQDAQLSVHISVCDHSRTLQSVAVRLDERVGWMSLSLEAPPTSSVVIRFNVTVGNRWTVYSRSYDMEDIEVLAPPPNISASVASGDLLVAWGLPHSRGPTNPSCFEYQLDVGDQEAPRHVRNQLTYREAGVDPGHAYRVRIRTRMRAACQQDPHWSDWSQPIVLEQVQEVDVVLIVVSLGLPIILLAVLLVVCRRVCRVLFPPIPHPSPAFLLFLKKNEAFSSLHPVLSPVPLEEVTVVQDAGQNPGQTF
ncbi:granulocyte-macrophage colony-stimulating factor receptor subunit alpha-like [Antennarius striatus]|uniref:granulocyte-macrophage colony-stimulating factor receptor subunit alpha-like n=1 Tax=Antennarius striatus TaxID=241820 RepID=UPI0035B37077